MKGILTLPQELADKEKSKYVEMTTWLDQQENIPHSVQHAVSEAIYKTATRIEQFEVLNNVCSKKRIRKIR